MEALAMDKLVEKGDLSPQVRTGCCGSPRYHYPSREPSHGSHDGRTLRAAGRSCRATGSTFRPAGCKNGSPEARFGSIEKLIERTKVRATLLYAGLAAVFFGGLTVDHRWLVNREDQLMAQMQARSDARFAEEDLRTDRLFAEEDARTDRLFAAHDARTGQLFTEEHARSDRLVAEQQANAKQAEVRMDAKLDQLRALLINGSLKPGTTTRISPSP